MSTSDLLTSAEVARRLRVSVSSVSRWATTGVLDPVRVGGSVRFRAADIDALVAGVASPEPETAA